MVLATAGASRVKDARTADDLANVGDLERLLSVITGSALAVFGLRQRGIPGIGVALFGAELVRRGTSGHCLMYEALGVSTAHGGQAMLRGGGVASPAATVNARRAIKIERAVTILRPAEELYRFWRSFENLPRFMQHLESVSTTDANHSHWVANFPGGKAVEWDAEIVNDVPNELIAWKTVGNPDISHAGSVHFREAPEHRGTELRVVLDYEPPGAHLFAQIARLFGHAPDALVREELRRFKMLSETGEIATTEGQPSCR